MINILFPKELDIELAEGCVACSISFDKVKIVPCTLNNQPVDNKYRHETADFFKKLKTRLGTEVDSTNRLW